jgi:hypothetical protein
MSFSFIRQTSINSSGVQITGQTCPSSRQSFSMRRTLCALLMCLQFHVSRKSMPCTVAMAICSASAAARPTPIPGSDAPRGNSGSWFRGRRAASWFYGARVYLIPVASGPTKWPVLGAGKNEIFIFLHVGTVDCASRHIPRQILGRMYFKICGNLRKSAAKKLLTEQR